MLRVLTLSTLFPHAAQPTLGVFVERQTLGLAALDGVGLEVVSARGLPIRPLSLHPHYAARARLPERETWKGLPVHRPRFRTWPGLGAALAGKAMAAALLPKLRRLRESFPFDVIDAEFFWPDGVAAMHLSRALGVPFSVKARGSDVNFWGRRSAIAPQLVESAQAAHGLLAVSEALKAAMTRLGMPGERIRVHYTGIDRDRFRPADRAAAKAALGLEGPLLATAGALMERKGQALVLEALTRIDGASLLLIGAGPARGALEAKARALGLESRVRFTGSRPHDEVAALLAAADAMVLPSESEGLANVWVEALACGTPIVISDAGGAREVVDRPEAGQIVAREPDAIAAAVRAILADPPPQQAVRAASERFSWAKNAAELFEHLSLVSAQRH